MERPNKAELKRLLKEYTAALQAEEEANRKYLEGTETQGTWAELHAKKEEAFEAYHLACLRAIGLF